jgi:broad specificity phosphatase PhoE
MTTTLHLIRHAAADIEVDRYADHLAMGLSALGRRQAMAAARRLGELAEPTGPVISSPLARARQTAGYLAQSIGADVSVDARLAERTFPDFYGMKYADVEAAHGPELALALQTNSDLIDGFGAPSLTRCFETVRELLGDLATGGSADIWLVTHGGPLGWMLSVLLQPLAEPVTRKLRFDHVGYTRILIDGAANLVRIEWLNRQLADTGW